VATKIICFRVVSVIGTQIAGRLWFGDWHTSLFGLFLIPYCTALHYAFERAWKIYERKTR
jgi:hypothetical protein